MSPSWRKAFGSLFRCAVRILQYNCNPVFNISLFIIDPSIVFKYRSDRKTQSLGLKIILPLGMQTIFKQSKRGGQKSCVTNKKLYAFFRRQDLKVHIKNSITLLKQIQKEAPTKMEYEINQRIYNDLQYVSFHDKLTFSCLFEREKGYDMIQQYNIIMTNFNSISCSQFIQSTFTASVLPSLQQYIRIPNLSRAFDENWATNGLLQSAAQHICSWVQHCGVKGIKSEVIKLPNLSPIIFTQIPGTAQSTVFFYGHYDKQPPFQGWFEGLSAFIPVMRGNRLYGRGGADDGYSTYCTMLAIRALQQQNIPVPRCVMVTQGDEESGSGHIMPYLQHLKQRIGSPQLVFCLDSGTLDYDRLWVTSSLRGMVAFSLRVQVLREGVHSGDASGIVPSPFRIVRGLLQRIQSSIDGSMHEELQSCIPPNRYEEMHALIELKQEKGVKDMPFLPGVQRASKSCLKSVIDRGWKAQMAVISCKDLPEKGGNVMLPAVELRLSIRIPPIKDTEEVEAFIRKIMCQDPPYGAKVSVSNFVKGSGFNCPKYSQKLQLAMNEASKLYYKEQCLAICQGMSIPLLGQLKKMWPKGQFIVTGVLGPQSNAHGPNEFLDVSYVKKLTCCIAHILANH